MFNLRKDQAKKKKKRSALHPIRSKPNQSKKQQQRQKAETPTPVQNHWHWGSRVRAQWQWDMRSGLNGQMMDNNRDLHSVIALTIATNEVISLGIIQGYEIFATAPVPKCPFGGAVVIPTLVYFKHIVLILLVPKCCCNKLNINTRKET